MARYEEMSPTLLARLFEERVAAEIKEILSEQIKPMVDEAINKAVKEAVNVLQANVESYRAYDRFGEDIRITLIDKRSKE